MENCFLAFSDLVALRFRHSLFLITSLSFLANVVSVRFDTLAQTADDVFAGEVNALPVACSWCSGVFSSLCFELERGFLVSGVASNEGFAYPFTLCLVLSGDCEKVDSIPSFIFFTRALDC
mgnify:FL=1